MTTPPRTPDGALTFDSTGERFGPATTAAEFAALRAAGGARTDYGRSRVELPPTPVAGAPFHVAATFDGPALARLELVMSRPSDGTSWDDWTVEGEMARKREHEAWAARVFGSPLAPRPIALDRNDRPIIPEPLTWEHPRHAVFAWGEVVSAYDSRAGMALLIIRYGEVAPLERA